MVKACGTAHFTADFRLTGALELAVLRSSLPHARIVSIDAEAAKAMPGVAGILTAADIKGTNTLKYLVADRPVLCADKVRYIGDPILAVAAETKSQAEAALAAVVVELEPLPVMDSPEASLAEDAVQIHDEFPNLCFDQPQIKGDARRGPARFGGGHRGRVQDPDQPPGAARTRGHHRLLGKADEDDDPTSW